MSFHDYFFAAPGAVVERPFVGLDNYVNALTDERVLESFKNIVIFLVINVPLTVVLAIVLAIALNAAIPFRSFFRTAYFLPYVTASVATIGVWLWLFSGDGLVNQFLGPLAPDPSWLINEALAMPSIAIYVTWKQLGFYVLLYLAALQNVPQELYEAAEVDGASVVQRFRHITLPGIRNIMIIVVLLSTIWTFNDFQIIYILTKGGPGGTTMVMPVLTYETAFGAQRLGEAIAVALYLLPALAVTIIVLARYMRKARTR
jgi:multiple sugar transport system permease protein